MSEGTPCLWLISLLFPGLSLRTGREQGRARGQGQSLKPRSLVPSYPIPGTQASGMGGLIWLSASHGADEAARVSGSQCTFCVCVLGLRLHLSMCSDVPCSMCAWDSWLWEVMWAVPLPHVAAVSRANASPAVSVFQRRIVGTALMKRPVLSLPVSA